MNSSLLVLVFIAIVVVAVVIPFMMNDSLRKGRMTRTDFLSYLRQSVDHGITLKELAEDVEELIRQGRAPKDIVYVYTSDPSGLAKFLEGTLREMNFHDKLIQEEEARLRDAAN